MISLIGAIYKIKTQKSKLIYTENRLVVVRGGGRRNG